MERGRAKVLNALSAGKLDQVQERVAWLLNRMPETRDSDVALAIRYWQEFQSDLWDGSFLQPEDLYKLQRIPSLVRSRAKIQNTYGLFKASAQIQKYRGTLEESELDKARAQRPVGPTLTVYADESGRNARYLIVGSVWVLHAPETVTTVRNIENWKAENKFKGELHFKDITKKNFPYYMRFIDLLAEIGAVLSFKAILSPRAGVDSEEAALRTLFHHLLLRGVQHEHESNRARLPRSLIFWKDAYEQGADRTLLAELSNDLDRDSSALLDNGLRIDLFSAVDSERNALMQVADLFAGSLNRMINIDADPGAYKYDFAKAFLAAVGMNPDTTPNEEAGDMAVALSL